MGNGNENQGNMGWGTAAAAGVQSASGLFGSIIANKANQKLQRKQLDWNENMWHMNNAYNSPEQQMERMRDAGLHPMLALEGMGGGNSGSPAEGVAPTEANNVMEGFDPVGNYMAIKNQMQGLENMKTEGDLKAAQVDYQNVLTANAEWAGKQAGLDYDASVEDYSTKRSQELIRTQTMIMDSMLKEQQLDIGAVNLAYAEAEKILGLSKTKADLNLVRSKFDLNTQKYNFIEKNQFNIPQKWTHGVISKYILNNVNPKNKPIAIKALKLKDAKGVVKDYWKNNTGENSWRNPDKDSGTLPEGFYDRDTRIQKRMGPGG